MFARIVSIALVNLEFTVDTFIAGVAETDVLSNPVLALSVETRILGTLINVDLTVRTWTNDGGTEEQRRKERGRERERERERVKQNVKIGSRDTVGTKTTNVFTKVERQIVL